MTEMMHLHVGDYDLVDTPDNQAPDRIGHRLTFIDPHFPCHATFEVAGEVRGETDLNEKGDLMKLVKWMRRLV